MLNGGDSWEKGFEAKPKLKPSAFPRLRRLARVTAKPPRREISIARIGALFDHAFQLPLWLLCACCALFGDVKMLRCALATTALAMTVGGYWGLEAFYAETCAKHGACPTDEIKMVQSQLCPGVVGVMCLSLFATLFDKEKPKMA